MQIIFDSNGLCISYTENNSDIERITYKTDGCCSIYSKDGVIISEFQTTCSPAYNHQYGTPISEDGKYLFVGTWEKGLFCYNIYNGNLVWKKTPGKVRKIFVQKEFILIEMSGRGIFKRDVITGDLLGEIKMPNIDFIYQISKTEIFTGLIRNKYYIYEIADLYEKGMIPLSMLNINECLSFIILDAKRDGCNLTIKGWEQYPNRNRSIIGVTHFSRSIKIDN